MYWSDDGMFRFKADHVRDTNDTGLSACGFRAAARASAPAEKTFRVSPLAEKAPARGPA
jgi:hypothetical protein